MRLPIDGIRSKMTPADRERLIFEYISNGDWDKAIEHAKVVPDSHDIWQRLPSAHEEGMPNSAVHQVLDHLDEDDLKHSGFLFEMAHNLMGHHDSETLKRLANAASEHGAHLETEKFTKHPNYKLTLDEEKLAAVHNFWKSYEWRVTPRHFATIKSFFSGKPEEVSHRGQSGKHNDYYIVNGRHIYDLDKDPTVQQFSQINHLYGGNTHTKADHVLPSLRDYASKIQEKILKDENIRKRYYGGEPYIKVHRGIGGHYSKMIRDAARYNPKTREYDHKNLTVPSAPFSSWTTDFEMAKGFAKGRGSQLDLPGHGLIMSKWMPVKDILHSGYHNVLPGRYGVHPSEMEIIFGHPTGKMKVSTGELHFENPLTTMEDLQEHYGSSFDKGVKREKVSKGIKEKALQLGVAAAMLGMPQQLAEQPDIPQPQNQAKAAEQANIVQPLPGLRYIEMIESSGGKNLKHRLVTSGLNAGTSAIGRYGIMPLQAIETISKDKELAQKYPEFLSYDHIKDADKITQTILNNRNLETEIANSHWRRLHNRFDGNEKKMAHAWLNGISGTLNTPNEEIENHNYVKKYKRYKQMLNIERTPANLLKNEQPLPPSIREVREFEAVGDKTPQVQLDVEHINQLIDNQAFHPIPQAGHFTSDSFVVGTTHDNSWIIKVESGSRPGIISAKAGLQSIKEFAFYDVAKHVFGMSEVMPHVILGELVYENESKPSAAIKMLDDNYKLAVDYEEAKPGSMVRILEKYRKSGLLHKMAALLYILGDGDSHGRNVMTDGYFIKIIDHGSGFADENFHPASDENIFIPYIMRIGRITDKMSPEEKLEKMPKIENPTVKDNVTTWILSINSNKLQQKLNNVGIDPAPALNRLKKLQDKVSMGADVDMAINEVWVL